MQYNECSTCKANSGRCGNLIATAEFNKPECLNCHDTRITKNVVLHTYLTRNNEEIQRTVDILNNQRKKNYVV